MDATDLDPGPLLHVLLGVRRDACELEELLAEHVARVDDRARPSAVNLVHYLALRQVDLRDAQRELARLGLSSLGRAESHVLATLDATIGRLAVDVPGVELPSDLGRCGPTAVEGRRRLAASADAALGPAPDPHATRIMVTLPSEAATDPGLVARIVGAGASIARINAAHDDATAWIAMVEHVRAAARALDVDERVMVDLPGPKLRTGDLEAGPAVRRARPRRDDLGRVVAPAVLRLVGSDLLGGPDQVDDVERGAPVSVPVTPAMAEAARPGDEVVFLDARDRRRRFVVRAVAADDGSTVLEATGERTTYLVPGLALSLERDGACVARGTVGPVTPLPSSIELHAGDVLQLRRGDEPGRPAALDGSGRVVSPASVGIELDAVFDRVDVGHRVLLDDGKFGGVVTRVERDRIDVRIDRPEQGRLRAEKGINLPDTDLGIPAFTDEDLAALEAIASHADLVALSFVGAPDDVERLHAALDRLGAAGVGVVLKIEHRRAFEALAPLLLTAMRRPPVAVMVARGDLAVEVGFERMAEIQEEMLSICEAAHVPVIWATQVLESLAKQGAPTRAEVTDAAWAARAECVMLNKGPYIPEAIRFLSDVIARMEGHHSKRTPMLRPLRVASTLGRAQR